MDSQFGPLPCQVEFNVATVSKTPAALYGFRQIRNGSLDRCRNIEAFDSEPKAWFLSRGANRSEHFRCYFAMGKIRGTPRMRRYISVHRATTKYFSNSFVFKNEIEKEGLPRDSTPDLGAGGPEFKSRRPDQNISRVFCSLSKANFT